MNVESEPIMIGFRLKFKDEGFRLTFDFSRVDLSSTFLQLFFHSFVSRGKKELDKITSFWEFQMLFQICFDFSNEFLRTNYTFSFKYLSRQIHRLVVLLNGFLSGDDWSTHHRQQLTNSSYGVCVCLMYEKSGRISTLTDPLLENNHCTFTDIIIGRIISQIVDKYSRYGCRVGQSIFSSLQFRTYISNGRKGWKGWKDGVAIVKLKSNSSFRLNFK